MTAYYNENDKRAAAWLRELIKVGAIAPGEVDERDIRDVRPSELAGYAQCHFFAGIGVWSYALRLAGWPDDRPVWTGSCPCQPFSAAGKGDGLADERHLWPAWFHLIQQCRPDAIFGEQVASLDGLGWLDVVRSDLEGAAYSIGCADLCAASAGAPHRRQRIYFVADADQRRLEQEAGAELHDGEHHIEPCGQLGNSAGSPGGSFWSDAEWIWCRDGKYRPAERGNGPLVDGSARHLGPLRDPGAPILTAEARVMRLSGYGNAIVPQVAQAFIEAYMASRDES